MNEKLWNHYIDTEWTPQTARIWTETSSKSRLKDINNKLNSLEWDKVNNLKDLIQKREYVKFQKEIWLTRQKDLDWKLWWISFDMLELYLKKLDWIKENEQSVSDNLSSLGSSISQPQETIRNDNTQIDWNSATDLTDNTSWNTVPNWADRLLAQDGGVTLASLGNGRQSAEQWIFNEWPNLWILWKKLHFDLTSKYNFVKPHLDDLNLLSTQALSKIKSTVKGICISDKTITSRDRNRSLLWVTPRWYTNGKDWSYVWGCYRGWFVYAWRSMTLNWSYYDYNQECGNSKERTDSMVLHEIWHAFDEKYEISTKPSFKAFHKRFYNKIWSYFQQWWPWWTAWCSEFFAEASAEFHKWWEEWFTKYYSKDFYDYMKDILC